MKFYENLKSILLSTIDELASDPTLYARNPGKDFTRNRKLSFKQFIQMLLTLEGECLKEELYLFFGRNEESCRIRPCLQKAKYAWGVYRIKTEKTEIYVYIRTVCSGRSAS